MQPELETFRPSEYMRARRPELFSDSLRIDELLLSREVFEYHLDTLTSRKQEYEFEHFCRKLAEKEICPNLLPQTGPTGGGDSKTDTETYPVADVIADRWYEGIACQSPQKRWAFAFSAKKKWKSKIQSDVAKIANTNRGYKHICFISNQFIRDKDRSELEDDLAKKHNVPVHVMDRNWILKCVFEHGRIQLAVDTLGLTQYSKQTTSTLGPNDAKHLLELQALDKQIDDGDRYNGVEYQLAEDCMQTALLARNLGHPRAEVDGRFDRAERIARKVGQRQQQMRIAYIRIWSAFYWYDDLDLLNTRYDRVEELVIGSEQYEDTGKLANLWLLLAASVKLGQLDIIHVQLYKRLETLKCELHRLASQVERPNNALQAKIRILLINLFESIDSTEVDHILDKLHSTIKDGAHYIDFPFDFISEVFPELSHLIHNHKNIDEIFETLLNMTQERTGQGSTGCLLLNRGYDALQKEKKYEAIKLFSRAQEKLAIDEFREAYVDSLVGCALAYESAGLLWAARRNILVAANEGIRDFWKYGKLVPATLRYLQHLGWLELQLGRVPYVLSWIETASVLVDKLVLAGPEKEGFVQSLINQDLVLGLLLLKTDIEDLRQLDFFPQVTKKQGLIHSWMAILYALGYEEYLRKENVISEEQNSADVTDFFTKWLAQPASRDLPDRPEFLLNSEVMLNSYLVGCHIVVNASVDFKSICLGETILAVLEAFLATGLGDSIFPHQSEYEIRIRPSSLVTGLPEYHLSEVAGIEKIEIRHSLDFSYVSGEQREAYREWLKELMIFVLCQIATVNDPEITFDKMANEGAAFTRALGVIEIGVLIENILGKDPKFCIWGWKQQNGESFPLQRTSNWYGQQRIITGEDKTNTIRQEFDDDDTLSMLSGIDNLKHNEIQVHSIINKPLWDKAGWQAMAYVWAPNEIPFFVLGFKNADIAKTIFRSWQVQCKSGNFEELIRISIIKGINKDHPYNYAVVIGIDRESLKNSKVKSHFLISRVHQMEPLTPENLRHFLEQYESVGSFIVMPAHYKGAMEPPELFTELGIKKKKLHVRDAWEIGENDPDIIALGPDSDPVIPDGIKNPPVHGAIKFINNIEARRNTRKKNVVEKGPMS